MQKRLPNYSKMNLPLNRWRFLAPYLVTFFIVTIFFTLASIYPYEISSDAAFQIKPIQQWLDHQTTLFNTMVLPSHRDLSRDVEAWMALRSPGIPILFLPLIALGLPLGTACRITAYILFILGSLGWLRVADKIGASFSTKLILSFVLPMYSLTVASATVLIPDVLPFGIMPWIFLYTLHFSFNLESEEKPYIHALLNSCFLGFLLGISYWLKYSAFFASLGLLFYLILHLLFFSHRHPLRKRLVLLGACLIFLLLPVIMLNLLNQHFAGINYFNYFEAMKISSTGGHDNLAFYSTPLYLKYLYLVCSLAGAWGLAFFQSSSWLTHIFYFSDRVLPIFSPLKFYQRSILFVISGIPATLIAAWLLFYSRKVFNKTIFSLACCIAVIPTVLLVCFGYIATVAASNYLILDNYRYTSAFFIFLEIILIASFLHFISYHKKIIARVFLFFALFLFFLIPNAFLLINFIKNGIIERIGRSYVTTEKRLSVPYLSNTNVKSVVDRINSLVRSSGDVVVLATIDESGTTAVPWLEMRQRTLPLGYFWGFLLHTHGREGANLASSSLLATSKALRAILVISRSLEEDGSTLLRLKQRFTQAKAWSRLPDASESDNLVSIWYADLEV